jgi:hypothetical protein
MFESSIITPSVWYSNKFVPHPSPPQNQKLNGSNFNMPPKKNNKKKPQKVEEDDDWEALLEAESAANVGTVIEEEKPKEEEPKEEEPKEVNKPSSSSAADAAAAFLAASGLATDGDGEKDKKKPKKKPKKKASGDKEKAPEEKVCLTIGLWDPKNQYASHEHQF